MTKIDIVRDESGFITKFSLRDHAGYADKGYDIVCSSVSVIAQAVIIGIQEVIKLDDFICVIKDGLLECEFNGEYTAVQKEKISILTQTMYLVLKQLSGQYKSYICLNEYSNGGAK